MNKSVPKTEDTTASSQRVEYSRQTYDVRSGDSTESHSINNSQYVPQGRREIVVSDKSIRRDEIRLINSLFKRKGGFATS